MVWRELRTPGDSFMVIGGHEADHERRRKREPETALRQATPGRPAGPDEREGKSVTAVGLAGEAGDELVIFYDGDGAEYLPVHGVGHYTVEQSRLAVEPRSGAGR